MAEQIDFSISPSPLHRRRRRNHQGVALVVVMGALVLISFLVLTILTLNLGEQRAANHSAELTDVRTLAELPGQIVISQIRNATQNMGQSLTWTSQPGLIRVFDTSTPPVGDPASPETPIPPRRQLLYPLYSTRTLFADQTFDLAAEVASLNNWAGATALFADLNEPIELRRDLVTGLPLAVNQRGTLLYPILDPSALEPLPGSNVGRITGMAELSPAPGANARQRVPMPVRWLYVLNNGRVLAPLPSSSPTIARFNQRDLQPEGDDPPPQIIGRIAFWTDDESCKVNLNTASEPAPWLPPMTVSERDLTRANSQPVRGEFHRLSGHPSYTALSPIMRGFGVSFLSPALQPIPQPASLMNGDAGYTDFIDAVHSLLPGLPPRDSGSIHGTQEVGPFTIPPLAPRPALFTQVSDLLFDTGIPNGQRILRLRNGHRNVASHRMDESDIRRAGFCLTTHSSAPETNPFNLPKVSLWPVQQNPTNRTRTDHLMTLAASIGGPPGNPAFYGIQRAQEWISPASPGSSQDITADLAPGSRNEQLFEWLRSQTTLPFAGYGLSFQDKYGEKNRDQLLLNMFDMIRWLSNPGNDWTDVGPRYTYLGKSQVSTPGVEGAGMVAPLVRAPYRGAGRVPTITEAAIIFIATNAKRDSNGEVEIDDAANSEFAGYARKTTEVRAFVVLEPFNASPGHPSLSASVKYVLKGLNGPDPSGSDPPPVGFEYLMNPHTLNGQQLNFGDTFPGAYSLINHTTFSPSFSPINANGTQVDRFGGDALSFTGLTSQFVQYDGMPRNALGLADAAAQFPWFSTRIPIPDTQDQLQPIPFVGGDLLLEIRHATTDQLLQEIVLPFGSFNGQLPIPRLHSDDFDLVANTSSDAVLLRRFQLIPNPNNPNAPPILPLIRHGDVVRSVEINPNAPHRGDVRIIANSSRVPREWFAPLPAQDPQGYQNHSLREGIYDRNSIGQLGTVRDVNGIAPRPPLSASGSLLGGFTPLDAPLPALTPGVTQAVVPVEYDPAITALSPPPPPDTLRFGDWETGPGNLPDGPFFSRQDHVNATSQALVRSSGNPTTAMAGHYTDGGQLTEDPTGLSHTPQRQISSAVVFGALSPTLHGRGPSDGSTILPPEGWRTLLFCPNPASRTSPATVIPSVLDHPGFANPPDSLWLDFFWVPTVEPRLMSSAFATEGKINLNFQMIPFTWLERSTGIHSALQGVQIPAIPHNAGALYKQNLLGGAAPAQTPEMLYQVNVAETLRAMRGLFKRGEVFTHPSDICSYYLVPQRIPGQEPEYERNLSPPPLDPAGLTLEQMNEWWNGDQPNRPLELNAFELTGDNLRESPYGQVYPRLCTRSNVFKVHYRVQLLGKSRGTPINEWDIQREVIKAEQRGAMVIERFLDPNDRTLPDLATANPSGLALDDFYRYRILSREPFRP